MNARDLAKRVCAALGIRVSRHRPQNRFQAIDECLLRLSTLGYRPAVVVDVGANRGQFHRLVRPTFPNARYHLIEPQPACADFLRALTETSDRVEYHELALTEPGISSVRLLGGGPSGGSTGAYVGQPDEHDPDEVVVPATTLDELLANRIPNGQGTFLKLDVESHELSVLLGSIATLTKTEVLLIEVSFYDFGNRGKPRFSQILSFLEEQDFMLYDIVALAGRPRDMRLRMGDLLFVRRGSPLLADNAWE